MDLSSRSIAELASGAKARATIIGENQPENNLRTRRLSRRRPEKTAGEAGLTKSRSGHHPEESTPDAEATPEITIATTCKPSTEEETPSVKKQSKRKRKEAAGTSTVTLLLEQRSTEELMAINSDQHATGTAAMLDVVGRRPNRSPQ
ncbi:hypothetical protein YC2023_016500 [Brassica napus]